MPHLKLRYPLQIDAWKLEDQNFLKKMGPFFEVDMLNHNLNRLLGYLMALPP